MPDLAIYSREAYEAARRRALDDPLTLTDADLEQLSMVDGEAVVTKALDARRIAMLARVQPVPPVRLQKKSAAEQMADAVADAIGRAVTMALTPVLARLHRLEAQVGSLAMPMPTPREVIEAALRPKGVAFTPQLADLHAHAVDLAVAHDVTVHRTTGRVCADRIIRTIHVPAIASEKEYAVALHELGHVVAPAGESESRAGEEIEAWRWASRTAKTWTPDMQTQMTDALHSYRQAASPEDRAAMSSCLDSSALRIEHHREPEAVS